ncbi:hypothetical protein C4J81_07555 [Deltaproteobacteria bacterium Smac51]|nr:hypothetical protein C4J81_07555 [Deltaproteobacteria bacterium Smac51]
MARVIVSLIDEQIRDIVTKALAETKHEVITIEPLDPAEGFSAVADKIMAQEAEVIILDYWSDDAASVKLMQAVIDLVQRPEFIFIEGVGEDTEREQVLMAINEGARAFLPNDFKPNALVSYVERAISGPGRLRPKGASPQENGAAIAHLEETLGDMRIKTSSFQKLVTYLLSTTVSAQNRKVLVVSDSPYQLELLKKFLEEHNFVTLTASNPADGLAIAMKERPRIVVSDLELEGQTGLEFCQTLKFTNKLIPCYFIICTANQDKVSKVMAPGNGVDDCIIKPSGQSDQINFISRVALGLLL